MVMALRVKGLRIFWNMNKKRILYLDYAKGLGIIALLFAHTMNVEEHYIGVWITSWFMPIFFLVCGIILQKKFRGGTTLSDFVITFKKRLFQLCVPYVVFCLTLTLFYFVLSMLAKEPFDLVKYLIRIVKLDGIDSLWFIPCYFIVELFMILTLAISGKIGEIVRLLIAIASALCIIFNISFPFVLELECYLFVYFGFQISRFGIFEKSPIWFSSILFLAGIPLAIYNGPVGLASREFGYGYLYIINAFLTSAAIIAIFAYIDKREVKLSFLEYFGKDSIVILCTNNLLIEILRLLDSKLTGNLLLSFGIWGSVFFTAVLIILEYLIIKLSHTKLGVLFGKKIFN